MPPSLEKRKLNRIADILEDQGRTNKWLANQLLKHPNTVSKWALNEQQPHLSTIYEISLLLDCDLKDLIESTKPSAKSAR